MPRSPRKQQRASLCGVIRRVPAHEDDEACPFLVGAVYQRKMPGLRGRPSFRVTALPKPQRLGDVTHRQVVIEEGYPASRRALERWRLDWVRAHDKGWARRHPTASDAMILERWRKVHAKRSCWVLEFDLLDPVRCMADQRDILSGRTQHGEGGGSDQYVTSGGIDPYAEAVDPDALASWAASQLQARATRVERRRMRRRRLFEGEQP